MVQRIDSGRMLFLKLVQGLPTFYKFNGFESYTDVRVSGSDAKPKAWVDSLASRVRCGWPESYWI